MDSGTSEIRKRKNSSKSSKRNKIREFDSVTEKREKGDGEDSPPVVKYDDTCPQTKSDLNSKRVQSNPDKKLFKINVELDLISISLFIVAFLLRIYRLREPNHVVFDELHYGRYVSLYMKRTFFFDSHPPLGKQLIAAAAYITGFDGNFKFSRIGSPYTSNVPLFTLRFVPALCGSLLVPTIYHLLLEAGLKQSTAILAGLLILCDNALLTQSRFILMEPMLILFSVFGILCILKFRKHHDRPYSVPWFLWLIVACISLTCALCVKYAGFFSCCLGLAILARDFWKMLGCPKYSDFSLLLRSIVMSLIIVTIPVAVYLGVFYIHLEVLNRAGPHDSVMTSAFQASLEGGLASITKGQPLIISHGSQITLRHTHGRTCWLHSHPHVYPVRYPDKRGSSHQQQVTCYSFKDVNNWWIVKRPDKNDLVVSDGVDAIKHGDIVQLVHGITSRALNSHDVASPMSPQCQEVSCYIDYNVSMPAQNLWKVDIVNRDQHGDVWNTIQSHVRLIHVNSSQALRYSGRQLPDWGFNQHEVVTDKIINQDDTIWNVEEHRYTKTEDQKERERQLVNAEMIPTVATKLSFWAKLFELQYKMLISSGSSTSVEQAHMYSSEPSEWPFMTRGIAYWVSTESNAQVHLLGNIIIWYSATISIFVYAALLIFYLLRRRRHCYDLPSEVWTQFVLLGDLFFTGYLFHYIPYFFLERTLFLHHYLPAFIFKLLLLASLSEHVHYLIKNVLAFKAVASLFNFAVLIWVGYIFYVFIEFIPLCYGIHDLTTNEILNLRWKDTWDFIIHRN